MRHHLEGKDLLTREAHCSVCGPVRTVRGGNGWVCGSKHARNRRASDRRRVGRDRSSANRHRLEWHDPDTRTGLCSLDGAVEIEPWGRGWICPVRSRELGRTVPQAAPQRWCSDCMAADGVKVWLADDGCPRCAETDLAALLRERRPGEHLEEGLHLAPGGDPYWMPEYESAVPGWRTIGSRRPLAATAASGSPTGT